MKLRFKSAVIPLKQTHFSNRHLTTFFFFLSSSVMNNVKVSKVTLVSDERVPSLFHFSFLFFFYHRCFVVFIFSSRPFYDHQVLASGRLRDVLFSRSYYYFFPPLRSWQWKNDTIVNTKLSLSELQASSN